MRRLILAPIALALLLLAPPVAAQDLCQPGAFTIRDMTGMYVSAEARMRVEMYDCGGIYVQWDNAYGTHRAIYYAGGRLPGGGVAARGLRNDGVYLDDVATIGFKPAEPEYIQVITVNPYGELLGVYHLRKLR